MGILTSSGSLARVMGPLVVSYVYEGYGLYATYGLILGTMIVSLVLTVAFYRRLVPFKMPDTPDGAPPRKNDEQGKLENGGGGAKGGASVTVVSMRSRPED